jgi:hypothetical protein
MRRRRASAQRGAVERFGGEGAPRPTRHNDRAPLPVYGASCRDRATTSSRPGRAARFKHDVADPRRPRSHAALPCGGMLATNAGRSASPAMVMRISRSPDLGSRAARIIAARRGVSAPMSLPATRRVAFHPVAADGTSSMPPWSYLTARGARTPGDTAAALHGPFAKLSSSCHHPHETSGWHLEPPSGRLEREGIPRVVSRLKAEVRRRWVPSGAVLLI